MYARSTTGAGFTIVETLIFLAVSGLMFVLAISAMSGKQKQTEFSTAVETLRSQLSQDLSDVNNGNYKTLDNVGCYTNGSTPPPMFSLTGGSQAPNGTCTVIGEVIAFSAPNSSGQDSYTIYPAIGQNYVPASNDTLATDLAQSVPQIDDQVSSNYTMPYGLAIASTLQSGVTTNIGSGGYGAFGIFSFTSFAGGGASANGELGSGSEHVEVFDIPGTSLSTTPAELQSSFKVSNNESLYECPGSTSTVCLGSASSTHINPKSGITFCVNSGTDNESALFSIGGTNSATSANDTIYSGLGC